MDEIEALLAELDSKDDEIFRLRDALEKIVVQDTSALVICGSIALEALNDDG